MVKNAPKVDSGLRASRPNPERGRQWPRWPLSNSSPGDKLHTSGGMKTQNLKIALISTKQTGVSGCK